MSKIPRVDAGALRELAQKVRDRLAAGPAAVVLGAAGDGKAQLVAACTPAAVERGVTGPALLEIAGRSIGGGAGGKDILAMAGGKRADALAEALRRDPGPARGARGPDLRWRTRRSRGVRSASTSGTRASAWR